jgi:hypothetical protein
MVIPSYPVDCHMMLEKFDNASDYVNGGGFSMTSTVGVVSTYQLSQSSLSLQTVTSASPTTASSYSPTSTYDVSLSSGIASPTTFSTSSSRTGAESTAEPVASPASGLSVGAKAGIGIGAAIVALLLVLSVLGYIIISRRRNRRTDDTQLGAPASYPKYSDAGHPAGWGYHDGTPGARQFEPRYEMGTERAPEVTRQELEAQEHK